ncbi:MAG: HDOD domain-containing protein [candidate division Zixibacteria bacterium]|nr:HDOD domain-containing protein [candidate division Zixibacteria bacterium]
MSSINQADIRAGLDKFSHLPSIPQIILKIRQISENPRSSAADLANCILSDHQLTGRILKMSNSVYYGDFSGRITTVTHGIMLMGFRAVRNIAVSMAVYEIVNNISKNARLDITAFWTRSLACGVVAKNLAGMLRMTKQVETAFIAGFMHDIGQVVLAGVFPEKYERISRFEMDSPEIHKTERVLLGIDHLQAGEYVAQKWNLPEALVKPIAEHHRLHVAPGEKSDNVLVDLVYLGDRLYPHVMAESTQDSSAFSLVAREVQELVGVGPDDLAALLQICRKQVAEIASDLEIDIAKEQEKRGLVDGSMNDIRQQLSNKEVQLAFLQNASAALLETQAGNEILQVVCEAVFRGLQMGRVAVFAYQEKWDTFSGTVGFGFDTQQEVQALTLSARKGLFKHLRTTKRPVSVVGDDSEIQGLDLDPEELQTLSARAFVAVPIAVRGDVSHVILADRPDREHPVDDDSLRSIMALANQAAICLERNLLQEQLVRKETP